MRKKDEMKAMILGMLSRGCSAEDNIIRRVEALLPDEDRRVHDVLAEMVEKDKILSWRLPRHVKEDSPEAGTVPLVYTLVPK